MLTRRIIVTLLALALPVAAYAANSSLSNLSAGSAISSTDLFYDVQTVGVGGVKVTGTQLATFIFGKVSGSCTATSGGAFTCSAGGTPGGSNTQVQYNNSSAFGGISGVTSNGTSMTFASSDLILSGSSSGTTTLNAASAAGTTTATLPDNTGTIAEVNLSQTWSAAQAFNSGDLQLNGSSSGTITLNAPSAAGSNTLTLQAATDTIVARATTDTLTNKTITSSTDSLGGVTAAFGSDAKGDIYINSGSSNVIERLAIGSTNQCLIVTLGLPAWGSCGAGGSPGGSNTDVQFNNSSAFGGDSGFTYAGSGQATLALGTITSNTKALNITGTWNNASTTFDAPLFMNITNTASAAGSLLADFQLGGTSVFQLREDGSLFLGSVGQLILGSSPSIFDSSLSVLLQGATVDGTPHSTSTGAGLNVTARLQVSGAGQKVVLSGQDAVGILSLSGGNQNPTTATGLRVYNTSDGNFPPTNYERGIFDWTTTANTLTIGTQKGGTGSTRNVEFVVGGTKELDFGVTTASTWTMQGNFNAPGLASLSGATTAYVCWTTSTGAISEDSATCLSSLRKLKDNITPFSGATTELMALKPSTFQWKQPIDFNQRGTQLGFIAEDVASVDRKLASYSSDGSLHGWQDEGMIALLVRGFQEQQVEIEELKRRVR